MKNSVLRKVFTYSIMYFICANANSADYTVQVGSYAKHAADVIDKVQSYGDVFESTANNNLTRVQVGRFKSRDAARDTRDTLRSSGFSDAYVTLISPDVKKRSASESWSNMNTTESSQEAGSSLGSQRTTINQANTDPLKNLTAEEKSKVAYLDNELRILSDGKFYTIEQYRRLQN